ncbi:hypothetical protein [Colwellia psychrerythraea]|nr:hypothetical protein [Colwellia psychrerythraea]
MESNPVTAIPQGLPKAKILPGILLALAYGMELPFPVKDRSDFEVPAGSHDSTLLQH